MAGPSADDAPAPYGALIRDALALLVLSGLIFFFACDGFTAWDGRVVSYKPVDGPQVPVLIMEDGGERFTRWPTELVQSLELPADREMLPPLGPYDDMPLTHKDRFDLSFTVGDKVVGTTSSGLLAMSAMLFFIGLALRNMVVGGSPFEIRAKRMTLPEPLSPAGQPALDPYKHHTSENFAPPEAKQAEKPKKGRAYTFPTPKGKNRGGRR